MTIRNGRLQLETEPSLALDSMGGIGNSEIYGVALEQAGSVTFILPSEGHPEVQRGNGQVAPSTLPAANLSPSGTAVRRELVACLAQMWREVHPIPGVDADPFGL